MYYGVLRRGPAGVHGQKCSLSDQKGETNIINRRKPKEMGENGHIWTEIAQFGRKSTNLGESCWVFDGITHQTINALES